jgi:hypothetical protein
VKTTPVRARLGVAVAGLCLVAILAALVPPTARASEGDLFAPLGAVFRHPRCINCHVAGDRPRQGEASRPHAMNVRRGADGLGVAALRCSSCHGASNRERADGPGVPGASNWGLPPPTMGWGGEDDATICRAIQDPELNGGRPLADIALHLENDPLVLWSWAPGGNRATPPIDRERFVALVKAWVAAGGPCPDP